MHPRLVLTCISALSLALVGGCAPGGAVLPGSGDMPGASSGAIYGGSAAYDTPTLNATVALHQLSGSYVYAEPFCSGTLVTSTVVVTAAHCLDTANGGPRFSTMNPASLAIYVGDDPSSGDLLTNLQFVDETLIHPDYNRRRLENDIALVRLSAPVVGDTIPALPAALGFTSGDAGGLITFAGFGEIENGTYGVKLWADSVLGGLGWGSDNADTQVWYDQTTAIGPCFGDSGGPLFIDRGGVSYLGGITSYGDSYCLDYGVSTRVDAYEGWINSFIGTPPPPPAVCGDGVVEGGEECDDGNNLDGDGCAFDCTIEVPPSACGNGTCDVGESCDGRSGTVSCSTDCPGRTNGRPSKRYCYVDGACTGPGCP